MKKTFLAGLMAFCVCAMALTTVSCGKLEDGINNLQNQVDELKEKVSSLEEIIAAVKAQVAVVGVEETDSVIKLTLADGKTITVAKTTFEEGEDTVTITIDGEVYVLPKFVEDTASIVLGRTDFFLRYEGVKNVELTAEGIAEYYVMNEPDGWKATISENILTVTAPTKKAIEIGAAEAEGLILVHATSTEGKCKVAKLEVKAGPGLVLKVDAKGNITVENSYYGESTTPWGETSFGFSDFVFGLATPADFNADPAKYLETYNSTWSAPNYEDIIYPSMYNFAPMGEYVEGEYETDVINTTVSEAYFSYSWSELPAGAHFVVWVAPVDGEGKAIVEDVVYTEYVNLVHEVEVTSVTHSDAVLSVNVAGASSYVLGYVAESTYSNEYNQMTFEQYMISPMGGPWTAFKNYGVTEVLGMEIPAEEMPAELKLSEVFGEKLAYGENYKVWVMPVLDHLKKLDEANSYPEEGYYVYDFSGFDFNNNFMPYVVDVKTNDVVAGGSYAATLELSSASFDAIEVEVTAAEGTEAIFYAWYTPEEYAEFATDEDVMNALFNDCYSPLTGDDVVSKTYIGPGEQYVLATVSVGTDGKYGEIVSDTFSTAEIPFDSDITVELESTKLSEDGKTFTVTVKVTGADKVMGYNISHNDDNYSSFLQNVCINGHKASYYSHQMAEVAEGKAVLTFSKNDYKTHYYVAAYNVTDNLVSAICEKSLVVELPFPTEE